MTVSLPFCAPACPPETGASRNPTPSCFAAPNSSRAASAEAARELFGAAKQEGVGFLDAPVSGGQAGAQNGKLTVMVGGDEDVFKKAEPVMAHYARAVTLLGPSGSGQLTKMVNQIAIAGLVQGLSESLNFAMRAGLDAKKVVDVISKGAAQSWQRENRAVTMIDGKFDFGFA